VRRSGSGRRAYDDRHSVRIDRGENAGRTLDYRHVVRELLTFELKGAEPERLVLPLAELRAHGRAGVALVVQRQRDGAVLALGHRHL
jgi:hypothetical protein